MVKVRSKDAEQADEGYRRIAKVRRHSVVFPAHKALFTRTCPQRKNIIKLGLRGDNSIIFAFPIYFIGYAGLFKGFTGLAVSCITFLHNLLKSV